MTVPSQGPQVVAAMQGPTYRVGVELVTFKAVAEETGGAYSLFETRTPPLSGAPPHLQRYEDEAFFVLEGEYEFLIAGARHELCAGAYAFVPRGTVHAYTNRSTATGRMLVLVTPGGIHEHYFAEVGEPIPEPQRPPDPSRPPSLAWLTAVAARHGIEVLPRPDT